MPKTRSFSAKLAHEISTEGKTMCPKCNQEIKKVKLIRARNSKANSWAHKYDFVDMCKCNEKDILTGKI